MSDLTFLEERRAPEEEKDARAHALATSRVREAEEKEQAEQDAIRLAEEQALAAKQAEKEAKLQAEEEAKRQAEEKTRAEQTAKAPAKPGEADAASKRKKSRAEEPKPNLRKGEPPRRRGSSCPCPASLLSSVPWAPPTSNVWTVAGR